MRLSLRDLKPKHIQEYYQYKYTSGRLDNKPGGLSIPSIKKHGIFIKEVLDDAVLEELIVRNPAVGVKLPAKNLSMREEVFLTSETANEVLKAFDGHPLQALVYTTLYYGLRRSEVLGLRWNSIDFEKNTLTINHTVVKNRTIVEKDTVKTQSSYHTYVLIDDVKKVLLQERDRRRERRLAQPFRTRILPYRNALRKGQKIGVLMRIENHFGENPAKHAFGEKPKYCLAKRVV